MKFESDLFNLKREVRKFVDELTPEENENLNAHLVGIDKIIEKAFEEKLKRDGIITND